MPGDSRSALDWRSFAIPLRVVAAFVVVVGGLWDLSGPLPAEGRGTIYAARAVAVVVAAGTLAAR